MRLLRVSLSYTDASKQLYKLSCQTGHEGCLSSSLTNKELQRKKPRRSSPLSTLPTLLKGNFFNPTNACHLRSVHGEIPRAGFVSHDCVSRTKLSRRILGTVKNMLFTYLRMLSSFLTASLRCCHQKSSFRECVR